MTEFEIVFQNAINSFHQMRSATDEHSFMHIGTFYFKDAIYGFNSGYSKKHSCEVITVRKISKVNNESNMGANNWYRLETTEHGYELGQHIG